MKRLYWLTQPPVPLPGLERPGLEVTPFGTSRKLLAAVKRQPPDLLLAPYVHGYSNDYAGITTSNLDVLLYGLQRYAPHCRVVILAPPGELAHARKLAKIFPLHRALGLPVDPVALEEALTGHQ